MDGPDALGEELQQTVEQSLLPLFQARDAAARLVEALPWVYPSGRLVAPDGQAQRAWELAGLFFFNQGRYHEALSIFTSLYHAVLRAQDEAAPDGGRAANELIRQ